MTVGAYSSDEKEYDVCGEEILELTDGENPLKFLNNRPLAKAMIRGMSDLERLRGWRLAEQRHMTRDQDPLEIHKKLDAREAALRGEPVEPTTTPTPTPATATDGGTDAATTDSETQSESEAPTESHPSPEPQQAHPESNLEPSEALEVDGPDGHEVIFPAPESADEPYVCASYTDGDLEGTEHITQSMAFDRLQYGEKTTVSEIDVDAPEEAATNGGDA